MTWFEYVLLAAIVAFTISTVLVVNRLRTRALRADRLHKAAQEAVTEVFTEKRQVEKERDWLARKLLHHDLRGPMSHHSDPIRAWADAARAAIEEEAS